MLLVSVGGRVMRTYPLPIKDSAICLGFAASTLVWGLLFRALPAACFRCLVKKEPKAAEPAISKPTSSPQKRSNPSSSSKGSPSKRQQPGLPSPASRPAFNVEAIIRAGGMAALRQPHASSNPTSTSPRTRNDSGSTSSSGGDDPRSKQRNYKNMTRERRVEANARERQRQGEINTGFDKLREKIPHPGPSNGKCEKLRKIDILHVAIEYIRY